MEIHLAHMLRNRPEWLKAQGVPVAQNNQLYAEQQPTDARRLGLVLGGGGGKGSAHLGVLSVLEELDIPIDLIVGSSIGGAIGVLYAAGLSFAEIEQAFRDNAIRRIFVRDASGTGLIGVRKRQEVLTHLLEDRTFADLRMPCAVIATDLASGEMVVLDQGPLVPAVMATTAIPGIFPPVVRDTQVLADGSVLNDLPVDVAEQHGAQRVIAVELSNTSPLDGFNAVIGVPPSFVGNLAITPRQLAIASRSLSLVLAQATKLRLEQHPPALLIRPAIDHIPTLDMTQPDEGRRAGEVAARAVMDDLLALRAWRVATPAVKQAPFWRRFAAILGSLQWLNLAVGSDDRRLGAPN